MNEYSMNSGSIEHETKVLNSILVVEDDEGLNRLIRKKLEKAGSRTNGVLKGADAIALAIENPNILMLLDYILPDMTGKEVIETLKEREYSIPFIITTGHGDEKIAVDMMKLGARDYIIKDINFMEFLPQVVIKIVEELNNEKKLAKARKALQESEEILKAQYKNFPLPTYSWKKLGNDFVLFDYNDAALKISEGKIANYIGRKLTNVFFDNQEILEAFNQCYKERTSINKKMKHDFSKKEKDLDVSYIFVSPDMITVHTRDTTENTKAIKALSEAERVIEKNEKKIMELNMKLEEANKILSEANEMKTHEIRNNILVEVR